MRLLKAFFLRPPSPKSIPSAASSVPTRFSSMERPRPCAAPTPTRQRRSVAVAASSAPYYAGTAADVDAFSRAAQDKDGSIRAGNSDSGGRPLWIDTDVGFDDLVAIGCCVPADASAPRETTAAAARAVSPRKVAGISTVGTGMLSNPSDGAAIVRGLFRRGSPTTAPDPTSPDPPAPIVAGLDGRNDGPDPPWLAGFREAMSSFCASEGILLPSDGRGEGENSQGMTDGNERRDEASAAFAPLSARKKGDEAANRDGKVDLMCLGPLTNLAHWIEAMPGFSADRLNSVWILGGNLPTRGCRSRSRSTGRDPEFNFTRDPEAVRAVFHHAGLRGTTIHVVPQEVCNQRAFEASFFHLPPGHLRQDDPAATKEDSRQRMPSAADIIEDWLQSSTSHLSRASGADSNNAVAAASVSSLLPSWMVRLIRMSTFSVYGDPICMYVRDHAGISDRDCGDGDDSDSRNGVEGDGRKPRIRWKSYSTGVGGGPGADEEVIAVAPDGRLVLELDGEGETAGDSPTVAAAAGPSPPAGSMAGRGDELHRRHRNGGRNPGIGITVRIAHEVELGPVYMDWLARSLLSPTRQNL